MNLKNKYNVSPEFEELFTFSGKEEELEHEAKMIMFRFLSELEKMADAGKIKKKDLAKKIGTSASYITQLFNGDKLTNLITLAKMQLAYDFTFEIKAAPNGIAYETKVKDMDYHKILSVRPNLQWINGVLHQDYGTKELNEINSSNLLKVA
jgi:transcriptional regulator with XRE-family HTH domain